MALPEIVVPAIAQVSTPTLVCAAGYSLWATVRSVIVLVASAVAMRTADDKRRDACVVLVDKLTRRTGRRQ
jgi:hypothetical protein